MSGKTTYGYIDLYHAKRRREIIEKHPELRDLMKIDRSFKFVAFSCAVTHFLVACMLKDSDLSLVLIMAIFVGPLFNCALVNSLHETVHDLVIYGNPMANKIFGNIVNCSLGWPLVGGYYRSHRNHHSYLGTDLDVKYPSMDEAKGYDYSLWGRLKFIFLHPINGGPRWDKYVKEDATSYAIWNARSVWLTDILVLVCFGYKSLVYLLISYFLNDTIYIQGSKNFVDHWVDEETTYTSSYYGPVNMINFNIGYHREHHDFPNIPGRYLASVYKLATEFYSNRLYIADSVYTGVWQLLTADYGKGLIKHANKLTLKQVSSVKP